MARFDYGGLDPELFREDKEAQVETPAYLQASNQNERAPQNMALFTAAVAGSAHGVREALKRGAQANCFFRPEDQKNALHICSENGNEEIVDLLLETAEVDLICASTKDTHAD